MADLRRFRCPGRPQQSCGGQHFTIVYMLNEDGTTTLPIYVCHKCRRTQAAWDHEYNQWYTTAYVED